MAKTSETTISKTDALNHLRLVKSMSELTCEKIIGFHLIKNQQEWGMAFTLYRFRW